jgi:hypothetical protein
MNKFLFLPLILLSVNSFARLICIPVDFITIQEGINHCRDHDTIIIYPGLFEESVIIENKKLVIMALSSIKKGNPLIEGTTIDGDHSRCFITYSHSQMVVPEDDSSRCMISFSSHAILSSKTSQPAKPQIIFEQV